nr:hypothetical protein [Gammaproteobacteria bacterium]
MKRAVGVGIRVIREIKKTRTVIEQPGCVLASHQDIFACFTLLMSLVSIYFSYKEDIDEFLQPLLDFVKNFLSLARVTERAEPEAPGQVIANEERSQQLIMPQRPGFQALPLVWQARVNVAMHV